MKIGIITFTDRGTLLGKKRQRQSRTSGNSNRGAAQKGIL